MQIDFPTNKLAQLENDDYVNAFFPFFLRLLLYDEPKHLVEVVLRPARLEIPAQCSSVCPISGIPKGDVGLLGRSG